MLNFFIILLTNIATGVIIYLILSLKLEKSSSEYQAKKFKREADEMIREFNASAERNISMLENRITLLKKLLKLSGNLKSIDLSSIENVSHPSTQKKEPLLDQADEGVGKKADRLERSSKMDYVVDEKLEIQVAKLDDADNVEEEKAIVRDEEFVKRFAEAGNKHDVLVQFYKEGHPLDKICAYSGISAAEVELILNLNGIELR